MMMTETRKSAVRINWLCVQRAFFYLIAFGFTFAAGGWLVSIRVQEASLVYKNQATHKFEQVQKVAGPNPEATIKCERRRGDIAEHVAETAKNDVVLGAPSADLNSIPDCPPPPEKPPASAPK